MKPSRSFFRGGGCGFLAATCLVTCCFLVINSMLVHLGFEGLKHASRPYLDNVRVEQLIKFAAPVLFVVAEWWVVDWLVDRLSRDRQGP